MKDTHLHEEHDHLPDPTKKVIDNTTNRYNRLYQVVAWIGGTPSMEQLDEIIRIVKEDFLTDNANIY